MRRPRFTFSTRSLMKAIVVIAFVLAVPRVYQSLRPPPEIPFGMYVGPPTDHYWDKLAPYVVSLLFPSHVLLLAVPRPPAACVKLALAIDYCFSVSYMMMRSVVVGPASILVWPDSCFDSSRPASMFVCMRLWPSIGTSAYQIGILVFLLIAFGRPRRFRIIRLAGALAIVGWRFYSWLSIMRFNRFFSEDGQLTWVPLRGWQKPPVFRSDLYEPIRLAFLAGFLVAIVIHEIGLWRNRVQTASQGTSPGAPTVLE